MKKYLKFFLLFLSVFVLTACDGEKVDFAPIVDELSQIYTHDDTSAGVKRDLNLKTKSEVYPNAKIFWESLNLDLVEHDGTIHRPKDNELHEAVITLRIVYKLEEKNIEFKFYVLGLDTSEYINVVLDYGDKKETIIVEKDFPITNLEDPEKNKHLFIGWYLEDKLFDLKTPITEEITLTAKWEELYEISLDGEGLTVDKEGYLSSGSIVTVSLDIPVGKKISSITVNNEPATLNEDNKLIITITKDTVVSVYYEDILLDVELVIFDETTTQKITYGNTLIIDEPNITGYKFIGWYLEDELFELDTPITKNITLEARFEVLTFTVEFYVENELIDTQIVKYNEDASYPVVPEKLGYTFSWDTSVNNVVEDLLVIGSYELITYNITYELNEGINNELNPTTFTVEDEITLLPATKEGYKFIGWYLDNEEVTTINNFAKDITLEARFEVLTFTVEFYVEDELLDTQIVKYNEDASYPVVPEKLGYTFSWDTLVNNVVEDLLVIGSYELITYNITYELNEGINNELNPTTFTVEDEITLLPASKEGYKFIGWYLDNEEVTTINNFAKDITLEARFKELTFTINFDEQYIEVDISENILYGTSITIKLKEENSYLIEKVLLNNVDITNEFVNNEYEVIVTENITITQSTIEILDVLSFIQLKDNQTKYLKGYITGLIDNRYAFISDENGQTIVIYNNVTSYNIGDLVVIEGERSTYRGLNQIANNKLIKLISTNNYIDTTTTKTYQELEAIDQGRKINIENEVVKDINTNSRTITTQNGVKIRFESSNAFSKLNVKVNDKINIINTHVGWFNGLQLLAVDENSIEIIEPTDLEKLEEDLEKINLPTELYEATTFELILQGQNGSDLVYTTDSELIEITNNELKVLTFTEEVIITIKLTATLNSEVKEKEFTVTLKVSGEEQETILATYDFTEFSGERGKEFSSETALVTAFNGVSDNTNMLVSATNLSKIYQGNGNGGNEYENSEKVLKTGSSKANGTMTLTFAENVTKVTLLLRGWGSTDTLTINGVTKTLPSTLEEITFELDEASSVLSFEFGKRALIEGMIVFGE